MFLWPPAHDIDARSPVHITYRVGAGFAGAALALPAAAVVAVLVLAKLHLLIKIILTIDNRNILHSNNIKDTFVKSVEEFCRRGVILLCEVRQP